MKHGTLGHRESDKPGLSEHTGVLDREAPTSKRQRRWWEYVTGIKDYDGITGDIDYFSILDGDVIDGKYHLFIEDDFHQEFYEYYLQPTDVEVRVIGAIDD